MHRWKVGDLDVSRVLEMEERFLAPTDMFPDATKEVLEAHRSWLEPHALCPETDKLILPIQSYLLRTRHHTILIDTCVGNDKTIDWHKPWNRRKSDAYLTSLAHSGVGPEDIDFVLCTHLHADHCGWNTRLVNRRWVPTFPNARYVIAKAEYERCEANADNDDQTFVENVLPLVAAGQQVLVDTDYALDDEIWLEPTPGHTAGHVSIRMRSQAQEAVMTGDLIHCPIQCLYPDWNFRYDQDPEQARRTRRTFLERCCELNWLVLTAHFPLPSVGRVVARDAAFWFVYED